MLLLVVLLLCASARGGAILEDPDCDGVIIRNIKYETQVLKTGVEMPYQLTIDYDTNLLFFGFEPKPNNVFQSAFLNLETNEFGIISGIKGGFAFAVDNRNSTVYLAGRDGIYNFDADSKTAIIDLHFNITYNNIWQLFYKDVLYYTDFLTDTAYKIVDGYPKSVKELGNATARLIAVDNNDNIYFANWSGLFYYKQDGGHIIKINDDIVTGITSDVNGNLYYCTLDGLYYINDKAKQIETLTTLSDTHIWGLAIERNGNIIVANDNSILRLKPTYKSCFASITTTPFD